MVKMINGGGRFWKYPYNRTILLVFVDTLRPTKIESRRVDLANRQVKPSVTSKVSDYVEY